MPSRVLTDASLSPMVDSLWKSLLLNVPSFKKDGRSRGSRESPPYFNAVFPDALTNPDAEARPGATVSV